MKATHARLIVFPFTFLLVLCLSFNVFAQSPLDYYNSFDRWIANFNPAGNALKPLNEIPRFKVNGFLSNWTTINVHNDKQVGTVTKDWRFQEIQWMAELEPRYQFSPGVELVNKLRFQYDAVYDWQNSSLYADKVNKDSYISHTGDEIVRELHLDIESDNLYVKIGKQQVVWGKMEGRWMDFINNLDGKDFLEIRASQYNKLRIPLWMTNATYTFRESSIQFLWIPDYEPTKNPYPGSPWWSPLRSDPEIDPRYRGSADEPGMAFKNHQWAARFDTKLGQATWSLGYMYGFSPSATNFIKRDNLGQTFYDPEYTRAHFVGSAIDVGYVIKGVPFFQRIPCTYRAEVVYKTDQYFTDFNKWDPYNGILKDGKGVSDTDSISGAMKFDVFLPGRVWCFYQPMFSYYSGWRESLMVNRWSLGHVFLFNKFWRSTEDRLITSLFVFFNTGGPLNGWQGMKNQFIITWKFSDNLEGKILYSDYRGGENDIYGQFNQWDNVGFEINYVF